MQQKKNRPAEKPAQTKYGRKLELRKKGGGSFDFVSLEERSRQRVAEKIAESARMQQAIEHRATKSDAVPGEIILTVISSHNKGSYFFLRDSMGGRVFMNSRTAVGYQKVYGTEIRIGMKISTTIAPDLNGRDPRVLRIEAVL